ncbi:hypothetical protein BDZ45DRAFT_740462 [Acephala macrosclerotiorum]|nr:hypothetical protein BDZ45DRAFT_740462 [Acephala macrosclerotiorum]
MVGREGAPSPTKSIRSRRIQLDYTIPAISFGPPGPSRDSEEEVSNNSDSASQDAEQISPTIRQQVGNLSLEHADLTSSADIDAGIPPGISALIKRLSEEAADPVLPLDIISRISRISPTESFREPKAAEIPRSRITPRKLLGHVSKLFEMAREWYAGSYDEAAWYPLIRMILIGPPGTTSSNPFVKHEEAHTRVVCSDLLSQQNDKPIPTVKVDHLLQFNPSHRLISALYKPVSRSQPPSFSLSAFSDPVAAKTFTCAIIQVKAPGGNFQEASYQIAIASAAILERLRRLDGPGNDIGDGGDHMPVVGWVVHGHFWTLHVSYQEAGGSIRVLGPYPSGNTATYLGLYRLLRIVEEVKLWGRELYFPYLNPLGPSSSIEQRPGVFVGLRPECVVEKRTVPTPDLEKTAKVIIVLERAVCETGGICFVVCHAEDIHSRVTPEELKDPVESITKIIGLLKNAVRADVTATVSAFTFSKQCVLCPWPLFKLGNGPYAPVCKLIATKFPLVLR